MIVFVPFLGAIVFFLVGRGRLPARRRAQQRAMNARFLAHAAPAALPPDAATEPAWLTSLVRMNTDLGALPMVGGNAVDIIEGYTESFDAMIAAVDAARVRVHVEFYIAVRDHSTRPFYDAMARARRRGVEVRVLFDHLASFMYPHRADTQVFLHEAGIEAFAMLPLRPFRGQWQRPDLRNHRKLVVVDGVVAFTGSQNLIDDSYLKAANVARGLHWVEVMIRIEGPAARELDAVFLTDWVAESGEALLRAGIGIHLYRAPAVLHAKHFTVDDDVAIVGSSNMDIRSFSLNAEVSVLVHSREFVDRMRAVEDRYRAASTPLRLEDWLRRPLGEKTWDNLARLTSSLQ